MLVNSINVCLQGKNVKHFFLFFYITWIGSLSCCILLWLYRLQCQIYLYFFLSFDKTCLPNYLVRTWKWILLPNFFWEYTLLYVHNTGSWNMYKFHYTFFAKNIFFKNVNIQQEFWLCPWEKIEILEFHLKRVVFIFMQCWEFCLILDKQRFFVV